MSKPSTTKLAKHIPSESTYKIIGPDDSLTEDHVTNRGDNVAETFVEHMVQVEERFINILRNPYLLICQQTMNISFKVLQNAT